MLLVWSGCRSVFFVEVHPYIVLFALFVKVLFLQLVLVFFFERGEREGVGMFGCGSGG